MNPIALTRRGALAAVGATLAVGLARAADNELVFSIHVDLTGPASYSGSKQAEGFKDYVEWLNGKGGIRGRKVKLLVSDTTFKPDVAVAGLKKVLAETTPVYVSGDSTAMIQAITPENNSTYKILMTSGSLATEFDDTAKFPYHFLAGAPYGTQMELLLRHIKQTHAGSAAPTVAIVHSNIPLGRDGIDKASVVAAKLGIEIKLVQQTKFVETDVGPFALALRQARPDYCIFHGYAFSVWPEIVRLARDYGMKTQFLGTCWTMEREQIMLLTDVADGYMGVSPFEFSTADTSKPMLAAMDGMQRKRNPKYDGYPPIGYVQSWMNAMIATKAIELTLDAGKPLTGDNLAAALHTVKDWDTGGIYGIPVNITGQKIGVGRIYRWNAKANWKPEPVSDWLVSE
jgi:branched-chain amino acid transport system substrate-binding protein